MGDLESWGPVWNPDEGDGGGGGGGRVNDGGLWRGGGGARGRGVLGKKGRCGGCGDVTGTSSCGDGVSLVMKNSSWSSSGER